MPYFLLGENNMKKEKVKKMIKNIFPYFIVIIIVILIRSFLITPAVVDGSSMSPTLHDNNVVILNKLDYRLNDINRFDIVVVNYKGEKLIKRVIGLPGEHIEYKDNNLYVDGFIVNENFEHDETHDFKLETIGYLNIPGEKYLVIGDNRNNSVDSRMIGLIDKKDILGSTSFRIFPLNKIGNIK